jgi:glycosyltransferase involved in cell wall biosynthesis
MTIRVVYLDHVARLSGGEIALARALPALLNLVDPHVILGEDGPLVQRLRDRSISVEVMPIPAAARDVRKDTVRPGALRLRSLAASAKYVLRLRKRLRELRPDLVHTNSLKSALYGGVAGRLAGVPVIWHIRDRIAPDYLPKAAVRLVRIASRILPTAVIANSFSTLQTLPELRRGVVVANTVVYDSIGETAPSAQNADHPFRVATVGRLAPWKGQNIFLDAFALAFPAGDSEAWIIGSAMFGEHDYATSLHAQAERLGISERIVFRGFQENVWAELAQIDTLVHCSVTPEPFGQVIIEGMAAGVPVIAADAGGPAEIITHDIDGLLTSPGDVEALAAALRRIHIDPLLRRRLVAGGLIIAAGYSPGRTADELVAVYTSITGSAR